MESSEQINKNEAELKVKLDSILSSNLLEPNLDNTKWKANETGGNETIEALYSLSEFFEFDDPSRSYCLKNFIEKKRIDMSEELAEKYAIAVKAAESMYMDVQKIHEKVTELENRISESKIKSGSLIAECSRIKNLKDDCETRLNIANAMLLKRKQGITE